ncbi:MAG: septum formation initiator family protein [Clostridia bacterium]|nr:septum formation initiator family protein [Clostridia bacterium]
MPVHGRTAQPRFFLILSVIAALVFVAGTTMVRMRMNRDAQRLAEVRLEQQALVDEIGRLEQQIEYVQTDDYVENAAREELGLIMPGEIRYMSDGN